MVVGSQVPRGNQLKMLVQMVVCNRPPKWNLRELLMIEMRRMLAWVAMVKALIFLNQQIKRVFKTNSSKMTTKAMKANSSHHLPQIRNQIHQKIRSLIPRRIEPTANHQNTKSHLINQQMIQLMQIVKVILKSLSSNR